MLHLKLLQAVLIALLVIITLRLSKMTVVVPMNLIVLVNVVVDVRSSCPSLFSAPHMCLPARI